MSAASESYCVGAAIKDPDNMDKLIEVFGDQNPFHDSRLKNIYAAMLTIFNSSRATDLTTVCDGLKTAGTLKACGGSVGVAEIVEGVGATSQIVQHAQVVFDAFTLRRLSDAGSLIIELCKTGGDAAEIMAKAEYAVNSIREMATKGSVVPIHHAVEEVLRTLEPGSRRDFIATGITGIDALMGGGAEPGELIVIGGRPAEGKSIVLTNIAHSMALRDGITVVMFSLEMSKRQIATRMLAAHAEVSVSDIRENNLTGYMTDSINKAAGEIANCGMYVDDTFFTTVAEIKAKCRRLKRERGLHAVFVDYIQEVEVPHANGRNRYETVGEISRGLKEMAKDLGVPVFTASQLGRDTANSKPDLHNLRESGNIEQDADIVILIYHSEKKGDQLGVKAELLLRKQRQGPTGTVPMTFDGAHARFFARQVFPA